MIPFWKDGGLTVRMSAKIGSGKLTPSEQQGLWRLMLKLPSLRGRLQIVAAHSSSLAGLLEAYHDASVMLERLSKDGPRSDPALVIEYQSICSEIEADIIQYCLDQP
jgi:hypothetical protein